MNTLFADPEHETRPIENTSENDEVDRLTLESPEHYLKAMEVEKARVAWRVAYLLPLSLVLSLPCSFLALWIGLPEQAVVQMYEKWFGVMAPLLTGIGCMLFGMKLKG